MSSKQVQSQNWGINTLTVHISCVALDKTRTLEKDIEKETKGAHRDFLLKFINTHRTEFSAEEIKSAASTGHWESLIDMQKVERSAAAIHAAGEGLVCFNLKNSLN